MPVRFLKIFNLTENLSLRSTNFFNVCRSRGYRLKRSKERTNRHTPIVRHAARTRSSYCYSRDDRYGPGRCSVFLLDSTSNLRNVFWQQIGLQATFPFAHLVIFQRAIVAQTRTTKNLSLLVEKSLARER